LSERRVSPARRLPRRGRHTRRALIDCAATRATDLNAEARRRAREPALRSLCRRVPVTAPGTRAGEIRAALVGADFESAGDIAVCTSGRLVGLLAIEKVFAAHTDTPARELMDEDPPTLTLGANQERAAWRAAQRGESRLAVIDESGRFVGMIPARRLLGVVLEEHHRILTGERAPRWLRRVPSLALGWIAALALWRLDPHGTTALLATALIAASSLATGLTAALPLLFARLGRDSALGRGALATWVEDVATFALFLALASAILGSAAPWR